MMLNLVIADHSLHVFKYSMYTTTNHKALERAATDHYPQSPAKVAERYRTHQSECTTVAP